VERCNEGGEWSGVRRNRLHHFPVGWPSSMV
jgi:hypothetical protein